MRILNAARALAFSLLVAAPALMGGAVAGLAADAAHGEKLFRKCKSCHKVGDGAKHATGPALNGILGAPIGAANGFRYSKAFVALAETGAVWDEASLDAFLKRPREFAKGTKMSFSGLRKPQDRVDVIAYLATFSATGAAEADDFAVPEEILAIEGDLAYGEYLSSECTGCHQASGSNDGIPGIVGWEAADFVTAMHSYKEKHRDNQVMQMITGRLSNEEIAALAAYFGQFEN